MVCTPSRSYCSHQRAMTSKQTVILFDSHRASASSASSSKVLFGLVSRRQKTKRPSRTPPRKRYRTVTSRTRSDRGARRSVPVENRPDRVRSLHIPFPFLSFPSFVVVVVVVAKHTARSLKVVVPQTKAQNPHRFSLRLSGRRLLGRFVARVKFSRALLSLLGKKKSTRRRRGSSSSSKNEVFLLGLLKRNGIIKHTPQQLLWW